MGNLQKKQKPALINIIWLLLVLVSILCAAFSGKMGALTKSVFDSAKGAVELAIGLIGVMALWLGVIKVAEDGGLLKKIAKIIKPVMTRLFPDVPSDHPAMSAIIMNVAANMLGLGNAATPLGIKAMEELNSFNPKKDTATNAMCLFLAINTSGLAILPLSVIAVRASAGATNPAGVIFPTIVAALVAFIFAIVGAKIFSRMGSFKDSNPLKGVDIKILEKEISKEKVDEDSDGQALKGKSIFRIVLVIFFYLLFFGAFGYQLRSAILGGTAGAFLKDFVSFWIIPLLLASFVLYGYLNNVKVYESLTVGAKEGFNVALRIIPFMVAILVAVGMFRYSGALEIFVRFLNPVTSIIGMPADVLPMALIRPLSGSGAFGIMSEIVARAPNSLSAFMASVMQGSTETTFYVLAVYFGAVSIQKTRHALHAALLADVAGIIATVIICNLM